MGYAVYEDRDARDYGVDRWAGYAVPSECDVADCHKRIDRGLAYKCEEHIAWEPNPDPDADDPDEEIEVDHEGCGLYFCEGHRYRPELHNVEPKPDLDEWRRWMLLDGSWSEWRNENPARVRAIQQSLRPSA